MKKISVLMAALAGMVAFSSCNESKDDHPVFKPAEEGATEAFLNTPVMANTTLDLTEDNADGYVHMTCSQPSIFTFAAPVRYTVEMAIHDDFATSEGTDKDGVALPAMWSLPTTFSDCSAIDPVNGEIAEGICKILGIQKKEQVPTDYMKVYFRLKAELVGVDSESTVVPGSTVYSNIVSIAEVSCRYLAIIVPDLPTGVYLRGSLTEWNAVPEYEFKTTTERDNYLLKNVTIAADDEFKIADSDWSKINYGLSEGTTLELNKQTPLVDKGGNIKLGFDFTGNVRFAKKDGKWSITLESAGAPTGIYIRGDMNGWGSEKNWEFTTTSEDNVYEIAKVTIAAGETFKVADSNWGAINYGGTAPVVAGTAYTLEYNGGNLSVSADFTGKATLTKGDTKDADGNDVYTLLLTPAE